MILRKATSLQRRRVTNTANSRFCNLGAGYKFDNRPNNQQANNNVKRQFSPDIMLRTVFQGKYEKIDAFKNEKSVQINFTKQIFRLLDLQEGTGLKLQ